MLLLLIWTEKRYHRLFGISGYKDFAASIFDRYGAEVFKASKGDVVWRGSLKGSIFLPELIGIGYNGKILPVRKWNSAQAGSF
jgi:hypothetical protein